ncbi:tRNA (guanine-N(1)-)-methyltransferase [Angomonas deanei]|uniref:tRNA (guanine(37)-N1)-methyltransferase n=1 Tax=Angomonas deanei TaxID=59799 RepID=A0A7G2C020_9TRYP|nr:tRNA (guanine-N(1)-)-methyltransferase [Angomonas deanei]CAD2212674.1 Met-10+ like-protein, putative [Angomonas deanei]|eukprot:EPY28734.1 tRNA (guanine-N(1)-)-methyltransferase [Angomonas deanei]
MVSLLLEERHSSVTRIFLMNANTRFLSNLFASSVVYITLRFRITTEKEKEMTEPSYRKAIHSKVVLRALYFLPVGSAGDVIKAFRGLLYAKRAVRNVQCAYITSADNNGYTVLKGDGKPPEGATETKRILMDPSVWSAPSMGSVSEPLESFSPVPRFLETHPDLPEKIVAALQAITNPAVTIACSTVEVELSYKNYTMPELLQIVLNDNNPQEKDLVALSGFEEVGHIAHVNLSKEHLPFKLTIGDIILDCNPTVKVVVNKVASISSVFREFPLEIIALRDDLRAKYGVTALDTIPDRVLNEMLTATVKQHKCTFQVPYNRVYWNSKLSHEHTALVDGLKRDDTLFDVMAGVGPFSVPAAQKGVLTFANDLNPVAAEYMPINMKLNKVDPKRMFVYNMDGRDFLNTTVFDSVVGNGKKLKMPEATGRRHVVMNLPAIAVEFLDVFHPSKDTPWRHMPVQERIDKTVLFHVYCFSSELQDVLGDAVKQVEHHMGYQLEKENVEHVVLVRDVAPQKRMVRVDFTLPSSFWEDVATAGKTFAAKRSREEME